MSEETALVATAESAPAAIPPVSALDESGRLSGEFLDRVKENVGIETPRDSAITSATFGASLDRPAQVVPDKSQSALDENGRISKSFINNIAANLKAESDPDALPAALKEFGLSTAQVKATLVDISNFYNEPSGVVDILDKIHQNDYPTYEKVVTTVVGMHPEAAISQLQQMGYLPQFEEAEKHELPRDLKAVIDSDLWETASQVPSALLYGWAHEGTLESRLADKKRTDDLWSDIRSNADAQARQAAENLQKEGAQQIAELSAMYQEAHAKELMKWRPAGKDENANWTIYGMVLSGALSELLSDPKWQEIQQKAIGLLANVPMVRLRDPLRADMDEREARNLAARFNVRLGQLIKPRVQLLDRLIKPAKEEKPKPGEKPEYEFHPDPVTNRLVRTQKGGK